ncbi:unnamed protein product [Parnassius apollo]|uniref:(apollo) hypothetical protein n=1 Tax=Parnassius apollo TaxID=110799 RepID=A0A8S3W6I1_PARAO|nr:unnamed protein product [Parnassius apollo]
MNEEDDITSVGDLDFEDSGSDGRVTRVMKRKSIHNVPPIDQRGRQSSVNKTSDNKIAELKEFIGKLPMSLSLSLH